MLKRNLTALVLIVIALVFLLWLRVYHVALADPLFYAFMVVGAFEMWQVGRKSGYNALPIPLFFFAVAFYPLFWFYSLTGATFAFFLAAILAFSDYIFERRKYEVKDLLYTFLILVYPMLLSSAFFYINHDAGGLLGLVCVLAVTLLSDAFALFAGVLFGKKKLIEDVSPKKTVAGVFGAYFGGLVGATATFLLFDLFGVASELPNVGLLSLTDKYGLSIALYFSLAILSTTLAIFGDLAASLLKRKLCVKDFGKIFPGHGGVMDRLDSLLFVAPLVALFFTIYNGVVGV